MKKGKRRLLTGALCLALVFAEILPTGFTVSANELKQEESAFIEDGESDAGVEENSGSPEVTEADKEEKPEGSENTETENTGAGEENSDSSGNTEADDTEGSETGTENSGGSGNTEADDAEGSETGAEIPDGSEDTETDGIDNPDDSGNTEAEGSEEESGGESEGEELPDSVSGNALDEGEVQILAADAYAASTEGKINNITWRIENNCLILEGEGDYISDESDVPPWAGWKHPYYTSAKVKIKGLTSMKNMFYACESLRTVDLSEQDMSQVTDMSYMFYECTHIYLTGRWEQDGWANLDTSHVTDMSNMFSGCRLSKYDFNSWDVSHVTDMSHMFSGCTILIDLKISEWNTDSVKNMSDMFNGCSALPALDVSKWNTGNVEDMSFMFGVCSKLTSLDVSGWNTSRVLNMAGMFAQCSALTGLDVSNWNTSHVSNMSAMFSGCRALTSLDVSGWDTSQVRNMSYMFSVGGYVEENYGDDGLVRPIWVWYNGQLNNLDVSHFDTHNVTNMAGMFRGCGPLKELDVSSFQTANVSDMSEMFRECRALTGLDVSGFRTENVENMENMFSGCTALTGLDLSSFDMNLAKGVMDLASCKNIEYICTPRNCFVSEELPDRGSGWYGEDGKEYTTLPRMRSDSIVLYKGGYPGESSGQREAAFLSGIKVEDKVYDSKPFAYEGSAVVTDSAGQMIEGVTVAGPFYTGSLMNGTVSSRTEAVPVRAGKYTMTFEVSGLDATKYFLTGHSYAFNIERRELTITVPPQKVALGGKIPDANSLKSQCKIEGLQGNDKLDFDLEYRYSGDKIPVDRAGIYEIVTCEEKIGDGADSDDTVNDYTLPEVCGTLTVGKPTSGQTTEPVDSGKIGGISWKIDRAGKLTIEGSGDYATDSGELIVAAEGVREGSHYPSTWYEEDTPPWSSGKVKTAEVKISGIKSLRGMFAGCKNLASVDLSQTDTGKVVDMSYMFRGCSSLKQMDLSYINTEKTVTMRGMFYGCRSLEKLDLTGFRVGQVYNTGEMFYDCRALVTIDLSGFETSKIEYMDDMFSGCCNLSDLDLSGFDVSDVWGMDDMFSGCCSLCYLFTPRNCNKEVKLPMAESTDQWKAQDGTVYTCLPKSQTDSVLIYRNGYLENENGELKQILTLSGIRMDSKEYDGRSNPYAGTAVVTDLEGEIVSDIVLACLYTGTLTNGMPYAESAEAPSQAGTYTLTVNAAGDTEDRYMIRRNTYEFEIRPRPLTIRAPKIIIDTDDPVVSLPALTDLQYTAEGLLEGEALTVEPSLRYDPEPDTPVKAGRYTIIPFGADAGNNYQISYVNGVLVIGDCGDVAEDDLPSDGVIPEGLWIAGLSEEGYAYTGKALKPVVRVYDHTTLLQEKTDYTISYKNNTKAYEYDLYDSAFEAKKAPTITVTGKGNYTGKDTQTFKILPLDIGEGSDASGNVVFAADDMTVAYNKKAQKPVPVLWWGDKKLKNKTDYTVSYYRGTAKQDSAKDVGSYYIELTGKGNFTGTRKISLTVTDSLKLMSKMSVGKVPNQPYTGSAVTPGITVKDGKTTLTENTHYTVSYSRNKAVGTGYVVVTGIEAAGYSGTKRISFKITGTPISKAIVKDTAGEVFAGREYIYGGTDFEPALKLSLQTKKDGVTTELPLTPNTDYTTSWQKNQNAGTATVTFTGRGAYTGTLKKTFKIKQFDIAANTDNRINAVLASDTVPYAKGGAKPGAVITFRMNDGNVQTLTEGKDYTLTYKNNKAKNDGSDPAKAPTVTIKGKGNFKGTYNTELSYKITAQDIEKLTLTAADKTYQNKKNIYTTKITITDLDGKILRAGTDYDNKTIRYAYKNETRLDNGTVRAAGEAVEKDDVVPAGTVLTVTVSAKDGGNYSGTVTGEYRITQAPISSVSIAISKQSYTGQEITPDESQMTVKIKGKVVEKDENGRYGGIFEIVPGSYKNNVRKGTASVTVRGVNNYGGTKTVKFTIKPKGFLWWWK